MQEISAFNAIANTLEHTLTQAGSGFSPAYVHGSVCGFLSAGTQISGKIAPLSMHSEITSSKHNQALLELYHISCQQLFSLDSEFQMLLPDNTEHVAIRAEALSAWCQGFLTGIRLSGISIRNEIIQDILHCLKEIAELNFAETIFNTSDEEAYLEALRYVRFAALLIHAELGYQPAACQSKYLH